MFPLRQNFFILEKQSNIENMKSNETESSSKLKMLKEKKIKIKSDSAVHNIKTQIEYRREKCSSTLRRLAVGGRKSLIRFPESLISVIMHGSSRFDYSFPAPR